MGEREAAGARGKDERNDDGGAGRGAGQEATPGYTETGPQVGTVDAGCDLDAIGAEIARKDAQRLRVDHLDRRVRRPAQRRRLRALAYAAGRGDREDRAENNSQYPYIYIYYIRVLSFPCSPFSNS